MIKIEQINGAATVEKDGEVTTAFVGQLLTVDEAATIKGNVVYSIDENEIVEVGAKAAPAPKATPAPAPAAE